MALHNRYHDLTNGELVPFECGLGLHLLPLILIQHPFPKQSEAIRTTPRSLKGVILCMGSL